MASGAVVNVSGEDVVKLLQRFRAKGEDLAPTMGVVAEQLVAAVDDEFDSGGRGRWPPLADSTLAARRGSEAQILVDTGRFRGSIRADSGPDFAEATTDVSYAVYHVSDAPRKVIPLRNPFDVPDEVFETATVTILAALVEGLGRP